MSKRKPALLVYSSTREDERVFRRSFPQYDVITTPSPVIDPTHEAVKRAEVIAIHVASTIGPVQLKYFPKLKHIACRSTGYDAVDIAAATKRGIIVTNIPSYGEHTVAEYAMLLVLSLLRRLPDTIEAVREGEITASELTGTELFGKTLGVIGTGRIGERMIQIGRGFGMRVIAHDLFPDYARSIELGFEYCVLNDVLAQADILSLHLPATKQNKHLINARALERMKHTAILINTSRGSLVHTGALIKALTEKKLAGAGLDVVEGEQFLELEEELHLIAEKRTLPAEIKQLEILRSLPNVVLTSHNAYNSAEALQRIRETTRNNIQAAYEGRPINVVNHFHK